jgi:DNA-binding Xre family transcriptional regulator
VRSAVPGANAGIRCPQNRARRHLGCGNPRTLAGSSSRDSDALWSQIETRRVSKTTMAARPHNPEGIPGSKLPKLAPDARARVRTAELHATETLLDHTRAASKHFLETTDVPAKAGSAKAVGHVAALETVQRDLRDAKIQAGRALFDAVAAEYLPIDLNPEAYSERLTRVVVPFVLRRLPVRRDDRFIEAAILAAVPEWDRRRTTAPPSATALTRHEPAKTIDRLRHEKGWTIEGLAAQAGVDTKQIYKIKHGKPVTTTTITRVAAALGCPPGDLIPATPPLKSQR